MSGPMKRRPSLHKNLPRERPSELPVGSAARYRSLSVSGPLRDRNQARGFRQKGAVRGQSAGRFGVLRHTSKPDPVRREENRRDAAPRVSSARWSRPRSFSTGSMLRRNRTTQDAGHFLMPGGTPSDPLNLQAVGRGEVIPPPSPLPEVKKNFDAPVNNFIPRYQNDPLGLMVADDKPPAFMYSTHKRKRKRAEKKKKDSMTAAGDASATLSESGVDSDPDGSFPEFSKTEPVVSVGETHVTPHGETGTDLHVSEVRRVDVMEVTAEGEKSVVEADSVVEHSENEEDEGKRFGTGMFRFDVRNFGVKRDGAGPSNASDEGPSPKKRRSADSSSVLAPNSSETAPKPQSSVQVNAISSSDAPAPCLLDVPVGRLEPSSELNISLYMQEISQNHDFSQQDDFPLNKKALRKALRIQPIENLKEEIKIQEKKNRDFIRQWRNPNLESPAESNEGTPARDAEVEPPVDPQWNKASTSIDPARKRSFPKGSVSRNVDSIVSPVLRTDRSQIRKRRRTVSECSLDSANTSGDSTSTASKALHFRRSSSPDMSGVLKNKGQRTRRMISFSAGSKLKKQLELGEQKSPTPKFRKNPTFIHGNYYRYYGYRTPDLEPDCRLEFFQKEWFENKDVLDIGCNVGHVTLAIAQHFNPVKIVGMDIDPNLIRMARQNIKNCQAQGPMKVKMQLKRFPQSAQDYGPIEPLPALTNPSNVFPRNIMFIHGNYVLDNDRLLDCVKEEYDTILALSITKWIHLNHGDDGLIRAFKRMHRQLRPGGILILEAQAWKSYARRKKLTEKIFHNYKNINLRPETFSDYLIRTIGFAYFECIGRPHNSNKGFQRPLLLFRKHGNGTTFCTPEAPVYNYPHMSAPHYVPSTPEYSRPSIAERMTHLAGYPTLEDDFNMPGCSDSPNPFNQPKPAFKVFADMVRMMHFSGRLPPIRPSPQPSPSPAKPAQPVSSSSSSSSEEEEEEGSHAWQASSSSEGSSVNSDAESDSGQSTCNSNQSAEANSVQSPDVEADEIQSPGRDVEAALLQSPDAEADSIQSPGRDVEAALLQSPDVEADSIQSPGRDVEAALLQSPDVEAALLQSPDVEADSVQSLDRDVEADSIQSPEGGDVEAGLQSPELEANLESQQQSGLLGEEALPGEDQLQLNAWETDPLAEADEDVDIVGAELLDDDAGIQILEDGASQNSPGVADIDQGDDSQIAVSGEQLLQNALDDDSVMGNGPIADITMNLDDDDELEGLGNVPAQQNLQEEEWVGPGDGENDIAMLGDLGVDDSSPDPEPFP